MRAMRRVAAERQAREARARRRRIRILTGVLVAVAVLAGAWLLFSSPSDEERLASDLAESGQSYLDIRNDVITAAGGSGVAPVLMTRAFESELRDEVADLRARAHSAYTDAVTTVTLVSHDISGNEAVIVLVEHTRLLLPSAGEDVASEYTLEHRLTFVREGEDWLLDGDEILSCGLMPETVLGSGHVDCSTPSPAGD
jgi:hypothetical protein